MKIIIRRSKTPPKQGDDVRVAAAEGNEIYSLDPEILSDIQTAQTTADAAQATADALDGRLTTAEGDIASLETDVSSLQTDVADHETRIDALETLLSGYADFATTFCVSGTPTAKTVLTK